MSRANQFLKSSVGFSAGISYKPQRGMITQTGVLLPRRLECDLRVMSGLLIVASFFLDQGEDSAELVSADREEAVAGPPRRLNHGCNFFVQIGQLQFDVPVASFPPGIYTCQINVIDDVAGTFAFPRTQLLVRR